MEEAVVLVIAFEADRVQVHVQCVAELRVLPLRLRPAEHVGRPAATPDEDAATVHTKQAAASSRGLRRDLADPEPRVEAIGRPAAGYELERQGIKLGLAERGR